MTLQIIGLATAGLLAVVVGYLVIVIFTPVVREPLQPLPDLDQPRAAPDPAAGIRRDVTFGKEGEERSGWFYLPLRTDGPFPCVVMNNGFGGTKEIALQPYALRLAEAGLAVLTYDYRHFGGSAGEPRHHFSIDAQIEDCRAAVEFARSLPSVDAERVAIWGTSSAGGYGVVVAASDPTIRCLVAQCPSLDHQADGKLAFSREGLGWMLRLIIHAQRDKGRSRFGLSPHHFPIVGRPGTTALITAPGAFEGYARMAGSAFPNEVCARVMLTAHGTTPEQVIEQIGCPALFQFCDEDELASVPGALAQAERMGDRAHIEHFPIGHFDIYQREHFEHAVASQIEFLGRHL